MIYFLGGCFIGSVITIIYIRILRSYHGVLRIDHSNPEKDICRMELNGDVYSTRKKMFILKVDHNADLSPK